MARRLRTTAVRRLIDGFTLIELLIVMALVTLLAGISLAVYANSVARGREAALKEDLFQMRKAIDHAHQGIVR